MEGAILKSAMGTRSLVNNAPIVLKPAMRISIRALFLLRRYWTGPIIRLMPTHKMFISGLIVALLSITGVQAEEAPALSAASTDPTRHTAGGLDSDRKSTRLNSSHVRISYAVFCLKKK